MERVSSFTSVAQCNGQAYASMQRRLDFLGSLAADKMNAAVKGCMYGSIVNVVFAKDVWGITCMLGLDGNNIAALHWY